MSSNKKSESARANGAKSNGPVTPEGKQRSSQNAVFHGILASDVTLRTEEPETYERLLREYTAEHRPVGPTERHLVHEMVLCEMRQLRIWKAETSAIDLQVERDRSRVKRDYINVDDSSRTAIAFRSLSNQSHELQLFLRYETRFHNQFQRALRTLIWLQDRRKCQPQAAENTAVEPPAPTSVPVLPNEPKLIVIDAGNRDPGAPTQATPAPTSAPETNSEPPLPEKIAV